MDFSPSTDRIIQICGHLLRQSVMGLDLSYEDIMEDRKLTDIYTAKISGEEKVEDRTCNVLELSSKVADVTNYSQKIWVDAERFVPLKQELYAKSGQQLKLVELKDVMQIDWPLVSDNGYLQRHPERGKRYRNENNEYKIRPAHTRPCVLKSFFEAITKPAA